MAEMMGIITLCQQDRELAELTRYRPAAALPFGGNYRVIDFIISDLVNSGVTSIAISACSGYRSVLNHLGDGTDLGLSRKRGGLFYLPPAAHGPQELCRGNLQLFSDNLDFFRKSNEPYVVAAPDNVVGNLDLDQVLQFHKSMTADVTVVCVEAENPEKFPHACRLSVDGTGRVRAMGKEVKSTTVSLSICVIAKTLLLDLIGTCVSEGGGDLLRDGISTRLGDLRVLAYYHRGYAALIDSVVSYYRHNMELLDSATWQELFGQELTIHTKVKDAAPAKYGKSAKVRKSIVADGCWIMGEVKNSVLFRGAKVHKGAVVRNSIIMHSTEIAAGAVVENAIIDKSVRISPGSHIKSEGSPVVIGKKAVV